MFSLELGVLFAILLDAALLFFISSTASRKKLNALSFIIAFVLLLPLSFQMFMLIGRVYLESFVDELQEYSSSSLYGFILSSSIGSYGWYIFRRVLWSVIFMAVAGFGIHATMDRIHSQNRRQHLGVQSSRRNNTTPSRRHR